MKKLLVTLALILAPVVASAAPQTITIVWDNDARNWLVVDSTPPIDPPGGLSVATGWLVPLKSRVANTLLTLQDDTTGKEYSCKATAFVFGSYSIEGRTIGVSSLKKCIALN